VDHRRAARALQPEHTEAAMSVVMGERTSVEVAGKRVGVIGLGRSGIGAVRLLGELGGRVAVADQKPLAELAATLEGLRTGGRGLAAGAHAALHGKRWRFVVREACSFQLETMQTFHPWVGAILNVTPDHLDRCTAMEADAAAKRRMFENQAGKDYSVLNGDEP